jgi:DNA-binding transcriptional regulator YdaS (Cro superfamily)
MFSDNLRLALKMISMTGAQLASELGTHKSVVSRWLNGSVQPTPHNVSLLTALIQKRVKEFRLLDWERDPVAFAELFGVSPGTLNHMAKAPGLPIAIWDQMMATTALRAKAYEGFFRSTRPSPSHPGRFVHDHGIIRRDDNGLLRLTMGSAGTVVEGWMIPLHNQLYCIAADVTGGTLLFGIFNGLGGSQVDA